MGKHCTASIFELTGNQMKNLYALTITPSRWWDLVWFLPEAPAEPSGWIDMAGHVCGGMRCNHLDGWVTPTTESKLQDVQEAIVAEEWCSERLGLDYEVTETARREYASFLKLHGLAPGNMKMLTQAVYPLARTPEVCRSFGIDASSDPAAMLLLLGPNCD